MIINKFTIVDIYEKKAKEFNFSDNVNLIVSAGNTKGKSSLLKSIYHCLGFKIKQFPSDWNIENMIFKIEISIGENKHTVLRQKNMFKVDNETYPMNEKEYSVWLQNKLRINMKLVNKKTKQLHLAYSSAVLVPFYIDQDTSWDGIIYKSTTDGIQQYNNVPKNIFDYVLGFSDEEIQELQNELNDINSKINKADRDIESLESVIKNYEKDIDSNMDIPNINENKLQKELSNYVLLVNEYNNKIKKFKARIINKQDLLNVQKQDLAELDKLLEISKKKYRKIETECSYCNSRLTTEQSLKRLELSNNEFELKYLRDEITQQIASLEKEISELRTKDNEVNKTIETFNFKINESEKLLTLNQYVNEKAKSVASDEMKFYLEDQIVNRSQLINRKSELQRLIRKLKREKGQQKETIKYEYNNKLNEMTNLFNKVDTKELSFLEFKKVKGSGIDKNKKYLSYYLTYFNLLSNYSVTRIPFCIDSFIKNETSKESYDEMFFAIEKQFLSLNNQVFFSIIKENLRYFNGEYNTIDIGESVLSSRYYKTLSIEINSGSI